MDNSGLSNLTFHFCLIPLSNLFSSKVITVRVVRDVYVSWLYHLVRQSWVYAITKVEYLDPKLRFGQPLVVSGSQLVFLWPPQSFDYLVYLIYVVKVVFELAGNAAPENK